MGKKKNRSKKGGGGSGGANKAPQQQQKQCADASMEQSHKNTDTSSVTPQQPQTKIGPSSAVSVPSATQQAPPCSLPTLHHQQPPYKNYVPPMLRDSGGSNAHQSASTPTVPRQLHLLPQHQQALASSTPQQQHQQAAILQQWLQQQQQLQTPSTPTTTMLPPGLLGSGVGAAGASACPVASKLQVLLHDLSCLVYRQILKFCIIRSVSQLSLIFKFRGNLFLDQENC